MHDPMEKVWMAFKEYLESKGLSLSTIAIYLGRIQKLQKENPAFEDDPKAAILKVVADAGIPSAIKACSLQAQYESAYKQWAAWRPEEAAPLAGSNTKGKQGGLALPAVVKAIKTAAKAAGFVMDYDALANLRWSSASTMPDPITGETRIAFRFPGGSIIMIPHDASYLPTTLRADDYVCGGLSARELRYGA